MRESADMLTGDVKSRAKLTAQLSHSQLP